MTDIDVGTTRHTSHPPSVISVTKKPAPGRVLIVDDDLEVLSTVRRLLQIEGFDCDAVPDGKTALTKLSEDYTLVLADICMPGMDGVELLTKVIATQPDMAVVMMSGLGDLSAAVEAMRLGAYDCLNKPFNNDELVLRLQRAFERRQLIRDNRRYQRELEGVVQRQWEELALALSELRETYQATLEALAAALDLRDKETEGHSRRVTEYTTAIAQAMGVEGETLQVIRQGALLHDIGKIGIPDSVLHKPGPLAMEEWGMMRRHPEFGRGLLNGIEFLDEAVSTIVLRHHERHDGTGYPGGLAGNDIPLGARIFSVADTLDAITADRVYRKAASIEVARAEIRQGAGLQFHPEAVEAFLSIPDHTWLTIQNSVAILNSRL